MYISSCICPRRARSQADQPALSERGCVRRRTEDAAVGCHLERSTNGRPRKPPANAPCAQAEAQTATLNITTSRACAPVTTHFSFLITSCLCCLSCTAPTTRKGGAKARDWDINPARTPPDLPVTVPIWPAHPPLGGKAPKRGRLCHPSPSATHPSLPWTSHMASESTKARQASESRSLNRRRPAAEERAFHWQRLCQACATKVRMHRNSLHDQRAGW